MSRPSSLVQIAVTIVLCGGFTGCGFAGPIQIRSCTFQRSNDNAITFRADLKNNGRSAVKKLDILASAPGSQLSDYSFYGHLVPGVWIRIARSANYSFSDGVKPEWQLLDADQCYPHLVYFDDGTVWDGGSPI